MERHGARVGTGDEPARPAAAPRGLPLVSGLSAPAAAPPASRWRASPRRLARLAVGLSVFGVGEALLVLSGLGVSPWTVLAEGVAVQTPLSVGLATLAISFLVLLAWVPLRQRPGLGTIANAIVIGLAIDATLAVVPAGSPLGVRIAEVPLGIALVALGSGLYLGTELGPGPRDGLMTGIHRLTGRPIGAVRAGIELTALTAGWLLGGTVGLGTLAFALGIGPAVAVALRLLGAATARL